MIDVLDCQISISRQPVNNKSFSDALKLLKKDSHFVVIKRYNPIEEIQIGEIGEIGFSTNVYDKYGHRITYFYGFILV